MLKRYVLFTGFIYALMGCGSSSTQSAPEPQDTAIYVPKDSTALKNKLAEIKKQLKTGDLIERADDDAVASMISHFSTKDKTFSHCGMVFFEDSNYYVYHIMAGHENPSEEMIRQPFDAFTEAEKKTGLGLFRYAIDSAEIESLHTLIKEQYKAKMKFDKDFNLTTNDKLYCAEMIYKDLAKVTHNRISIAVKQAENVPKKIIKIARIDFTGRKYIALDDLYLNKDCKEIERIKYADFIK